MLLNNVYIKLLRSGSNMHRKSKGVSSKKGLFQAQGDPMIKNKCKHDKTVRKSQ